MSIITLSFIVLINVRAPFSLKIAEVVFEVFLHQMKKPCLHFFFTMGKRAVVKVLTFLDPLRIIKAVLSLVLFNMVVSLHFVMGLSALVLLWAHFSFFIRT